MRASAACSGGARHALAILSNVTAPPVARHAGRVYWSMAVPFVSKHHHPLLLPLVRCRAHLACKFVEVAPARDTVVRDCSTTIVRRDDALLIRQLEATIDSLRIRAATAEARLAVAQAAAELARLPLPPEIHDRVRTIHFKPIMHSARAEVRVYPPPIICCGGLLSVFA